MTTYIGNAYDNNTNPIGLCLGQISPCAKDASACVAKNRPREQNPDALQTLADASQMFRAVFLTCLFVEAMLGFAV